MFTYVKSNGGESEHGTQKNKIRLSGLFKDDIRTACPGNGWRIYGKKLQRARRVSHNCLA